MSETAPGLIPSALRKPRARRWWALALVVILTFVTPHWLLFRGQEVVPGVMARPVGPCDVEWFERRGGATILIGQAIRLRPPSSRALHA